MSEYMVVGIFLALFWGLSAVERFLAYRETRYRRLWIELYIAVVAQRIDLVEAEWRMESLGTNPYKKHGEWPS